MIKKILLLFLFLQSFCFALLLSQPNLEWIAIYPNQSNINAASYDLVTDNSGNVYVTGYLEVNVIHNYCTIKYNSAGIQQWVSIFSGSGIGGRFSNSIALDSNNNVFVTGYSLNSGSSFDFCTVKYNSNGVLQWVRYYDGPVHGLDQGVKVAVDNAGNIYAGGYSAFTGSNGFVYTVIKYSNDGNQIWVRNFGSPDTDTDLRDLLIDNRCNIYITGQNEGYAVTVKIDSSGNQIWSNQYQGFNVANSLVIDNNYNVYVTGRSSDTIAFYAMFTIKYSNTGQEQWVKRYNNDSAVQNIGNTIRLDSSDNIYVSGIVLCVKRHPCLLKYTNDGILLWQKIDTSGIASISTFMAIDKNNCLYIVSSFSLPSPYNPALLLQKYDKNGNEFWKIVYGRNIFPSDISADNLGNIFTSGSRAAKVMTIKYSQLTGIVEMKRKLPETLNISITPNPFNSSTNISFDLNKNSFVKLIIYDVLGREVKELLDKQLPAGTYNINLNASNFPSGIYFLKLQTENQYAVKRIVLLK